LFVYLFSSFIPFHLLFDGLNRRRRMGRRGEKEMVHQDVSFSPVTSFPSVGWNVGRVEGLGEERLYSAVFASRGVRERERERERERDGGGKIVGPAMK
jgi:hypothetical protein